MSMRLLLLCPGQGGQHPAMFGMARSHPAGAALLERVSPLLPHAGPGAGADWHTNRHAQPLVAAATLAMWAALAHAAPPPVLVAGYSIGELSAWSVAGALDPLDAVALAAQRAALMDRCVAGAGGPMALAATAGRPATGAPDAAHAGSTDPAQDACHAMLAFTGLACASAAAIAQAVGGHLAIRNGNDSGVLGMQAAQAGAAQAALAAHGASVTRLPVAVASHTPCMAEAVQPFAAALAASALGDAQCPVLSGTSAERLEQRAQAIEHLSRQLAHAIHWDACMDACGEAGVTVALELGPGNALARMLHARQPHIACRSVADFRSVDGVLGWLDKQG